MSRESAECFDLLGALVAAKTVNPPGLEALAFRDFLVETAQSLPNA